MAAEWNVLVCMCGLSVDVEVKCAVSIVDDGNIKHSNLAVNFDFPCPFDVGMNGVNVVV